MASKFLGSVVLLAATSGFMVACSNGGGGALTAASSSSTTAQLEAVSTESLSDTESSDVSLGNLQLLAANEVLPAGVSDIVVGVSLIELHTVSGSYVTVSSDAVSLDLANLTDSVSSLAQETIAAGQYDKIRLTFSSIDVSYASGDSMAYTFSSAAADNQFVSPLSPAIAISASSVTHLLLDVGAVAKAHGFGIGASQRPSQHSALLPPFQVINLDTTGSISGTISVSATDSSGNATTAVLADAEVTAVLNGQPVASGRSDANGNYNIFGLAAGSYDIYVSKRGFVSAGLESIVVAAAAVSSAEDASLTAGSSSPAPASGQPSPPPPQGAHSGSNQQNNVNCPNPPWSGGSNFDHP